MRTLAELATLKAQLAAPASILLGEVFAQPRVHALTCFLLTQYCRYLEDKGCRKTSQGLQSSVHTALFFLSLC